MKPFILLFILLFSFISIVSAQDDFAIQQKKKYEENVVKDEDKSDWTTQDMYGFYINEKHQLDGSGVILYMFNEFFHSTGLLHS